MVQNINKVYETISPYKVDQNITQNNLSLDFNIDQQLDEVVRNVLNTFEKDSTFDQIVEEVCSKY